MPYQMEIRATSLWSKRKRKHLTSTQERLACPTNAHFKQFTKSYLALTFLGSGKIRLQNGPRSRISGLGKNSFTKRTSLLHF